MVNATTRRTRLKVLRAERGLTQIDTARLAGMNVTRYWHIEVGNVTPSRDEVEALAAAFGVSTRRLGLPSAEPKPQAAAS